MALSYSFLASQARPRLLYGRVYLGSRAIALSKSAKALSYSFLASQARPRLLYGKAFLGSRAIALSILGSRAIALSILGSRAIALSKSAMALSYSFLSSQAKPRLLYGQVYLGSRAIASS